MIHISGRSATVLNAVDSILVVLETVNNLEGDGDRTSIVKSLGELLLITLGNVEASKSGISDADFFSMVALHGLGLIGI